MSIINIYRGGFTDTNYYDTIRETENKAIKDIIRDDLDNAVIYVDGFRKDKNYILKDDELCTIRLFPNGSPGGGGLEIFLGFITAGTYTAVDAIVSGATGKTILGHAKEGLARWLMGEL
jgi:hypothetical protein